MTAPTVTTRRPIILIVDDRHANLVAMRHLLADVEAQLVTAASGAEALGQVLEHDLALALIDVQMPEMDGYELARLMRGEERARRVPIIFVTAAYKDPAHRAMAYEAGGVDYIEKPVDERILLAKVRVFMELDRQRQELTQVLGRLDEANRRLTAEVAERMHAEARLLLAQTSLQGQVAEQDKELTVTTEHLARAQGGMRESEARFRAIAESASDAIVTVDQDHRIVNWYGAATAFFRRDGDDVLHRPIEMLVPARHHGRLSRVLDELSRRPEDPRRESGRAGIGMVGIRADGSEFPAEVTLSTWAIDGRRFFTGIVRDVTERRRAEEGIRKLSEAVEQSPASVVITDREGRIEYVNRTFVSSTGYTSEEVLGRTTAFMSSDQNLPRMYEQMWETLNSNLTWRGEVHNRRKNGEPYWEHTQISPIKDGTGAVTHFLAISEDVTLRKEYEARILQQANYDELTGLPNRVLALDRLKGALRCQRRGPGRLALLFLDLDNFKRVNDSIGHDAGDALLRAAAERMQAALRGQDTVARMGGDEFAILLPGLTNAQEAEIATRRILSAFTSPVRVAGEDHYMTASVGITIAPEDGTDPQQLLRNAEAAMYFVKDRGRDGFHFFEPEMNEAAQQRARIEAYLHRALEREEFRLYFQPVLDVQTHRVIGAEALIRWQSPELGWVSPGVFIPVAEESGLITPIGDWVLETACANAAIWRQAGHNIRVMVNTASRQYRGTAILNKVRDLLARHDLPPEALELEITERLLMDDLPHTTGVLQELSDSGVAIAVDDFGTGYSSLSYIKRFPIHTLKIDRSFVSEVNDGATDAAVVEAIIAMGHSLDHNIVAEGVETKEQLQFLAEHGCDQVQGFLFSRAVPPAEFLAKLSQWPDEWREHWPKVEHPPFGA